MDDLSQCIAALSDRDAAARLAAARKLAQAGPEARGAAVSLVRAASDDSEQVKEWAAAALEGMGEPDEAEVGSLVPLLDGPLESSYWAATLLGRLGEAAQQAVLPLGDALQRHPDLAVRERAAWALGKIGPGAKPAVAALQAAAGGDHARLARTAARSLERIGR